MHKDNKRRGYSLVEAGGGIRETYSNHVALCCTGSDVRMAFGQIVPIGGNAASSVPGAIATDAQLATEVEQRVAVTLSWQEAKCLAQILTDSVARFEAKNGEIKKQVAP